MKRKISVFLVATLLIGSVVGCSSGGKDAGSSSNQPAPSGSSDAAKTDDGGEKATYNLQIAHSSPDGVASDQACYEFLKICEEMSDGRITGEVYSNSKLGSEREELEAIQMGNIQMGMLSTGPMPNFVPEYYLYDFPFPFKDREKAFEVLDSEVGQEVRDSIEKIGVKTLGVWENGFRNLTCNGTKPTVDDMNGMKIRTMENDIHMAIWKNLGANPTPMAFGEVYTALQQKTIDAQENPFILINGMKFYEVNKTIVETRHLFSPHMLIINKALYDGMSDEDRAIIDEAAAKATEFQRAKAIELENEMKQELVDAGCEVIELTEDQRAAFVEATKGVDDMIKEKAGNDDLFERFKALVRE